jgi:hypothetical protein
MKFRFIHRSTVTNVSSSLSIGTPLNLASLESYAADFAEMSDMFRYFKINDLKVDSTVDTLYLRPGTATNVLAQPFIVYYEPQSSSASGVLQDIEGTYSDLAYQSLVIQEASGPACPMRGTHAHIHLTPADLDSNVPWYTTLADASDPPFDGPGRLYPVGPSTADLVSAFWWADVTADVTFRQRLDPDSISMRLKRRAELRSCGNSVPVGLPVRMDVLCADSSTALTKRAVLDLLFPGQKKEEPAGEFPVLPPRK